jgi:hypothetical protein
MVSLRAVVLAASLLVVNPAEADHGIGVLASAYVPRNDDEAAIVRLIRTVGKGWERKDIDQIMSAYAPDAIQRAWDNPHVMRDYEGIRNEALGAFRDPALGEVRFDDWIHRMYIANNTAAVEINQRFHGWSRDHYYRDVWMFVRRKGKWLLFRYDYEPQPPFPAQ